MTTILFIGDIVGKPGRDCVYKTLPSLKAEFAPDLIIANGENSAGGMGINLKKYNDLIDMGIDVVTLGNHVWNNRDFVKDIHSCKMAVRPANYPEGAPGNGYLIHKGVGVINLLGRVFMHELDCPFRKADAIINEIKDKCSMILVDIHAEATSEKIALARFLEGRVTAVLGTHTHVQTADERVFAEGTAYISDVGMVGPYNSIIGVDINPIIERFLTQMPKRFEVAKEGPCIFNAVVIKTGNGGRAVEIQRINRIVD